MAAYRREADRAEVSEARCMALEARLEALMLHPAAAAASAPRADLGTDHVARSSPCRLRQRAASATGDSQRHAASDVAASVVEDAVARGQQREANPVRVSVGGNVPPARRVWERGNAVLASPKHQLKLGLEDERLDTPLIGDQGFDAGHCSHWAE